MSEKEAWIATLKVGDEVVFYDYGAHPWVAKVVALGKAKGRRVKIAYGAEEHEQWVNNYGSASLGTYRFAHIDPLTDDRRAAAEVARLLVRIDSKVHRLRNRDAFKDVPLDELRRINTALGEIVAKLPRPK